MSSLEPLLEGIRFVYLLRYAELAASLIVFYDHLITLDDEIELIWKSSWSMGKLLFIINRYFTLGSFLANNYAIFGTSLSVTFCENFYRWQGWTGLISCMIVEIILQMRLYALYLLDKRILVIMVMMFLLCCSTAATIFGVAMSGMSASPVLLPAVGKFCVPVGVAIWLWTFWLPILTFETFMCVLVLIKVFQAFRTSGFPFWQSGRRLVAILIRDSVLYFLVMFVAYFICLLIWVVVSVNLLEVPIGFSVALSCCLGNRLILNVRRVANLKTQMDEQLHEEGRNLVNVVGSYVAQPNSPHILKPGRPDYVNDDTDTFMSIEIPRLSRSMRAATQMEEGFVVL